MGSQVPFSDFFALINQALKQNPDTVAIAFFEDIIQFQCGQCTMSCQRPWAVGISEKEQASIALAIEDYPQYQDVFHEHPQYHAALKKHPNSERCIFLQETNLCFLHQEFGYKSKPRTCQSYPKKEHFLYPQYMTMSMQNSCTYADHYFKKYPNTLQYTLKKMTPFKTPQTISFSPGVFLSQDTFLTLSGWLLDQINIFSLPQAFQHIAQKSNHIQTLSSAQSPMNNSELKAILEAPIKTETREIEFSQFWPSIAHCLPQTQHMHQISDYLNMISKDKALWPPLTNEEKSTVSDLLKQVLLRRALRAHPATLGAQNILQGWGLLMLYSVLFQSLYLGYRSLNRLSNEEACRWSLNTLGRIDHQWAWAKKTGLTQMSTQETLDALASFAGFHYCLTG